MCDLFLLRLLARVFRVAQNDQWTSEDSDQLVRSIGPLHAICERGVAKYVQSTLSARTLVVDGRPIDAQHSSATIGSLLSAEAAVLNDKRLAVQLLVPSNAATTNAVTDSNNDTDTTTTTTAITTTTTTTATTATTNMASTIASLTFTGPVYVCAYTTIGTLVSEATARIMADLRTTLQARFQEMCIELLRRSTPSKHLHEHQQRYQLSNIDVPLSQRVLVRCPQHWSDVRLIDYLPSRSNQRETLPPNIAALFNIVDTELEFEFVEPSSYVTPDKPNWIVAHLWSPQGAILIAAIFIVPLIAFITGQYIDYCEFD